MSTTEDATVELTSTALLIGAPVRQGKTFMVRALALHAALGPAVKHPDQGTTTPALPARS